MNLWNADESQAGIASLYAAAIAPIPSISGTDPGQIQGLFAQAESALVWISGAGVEWVWGLFGLGLLLCFGGCQWLHSRHRDNDRRLRLQLLAEENALSDLAGFSERLIAAQEAERKRIAQEMHDSLGQDLLVIRNHAVLGTQISSASSEAIDRFHKIANVTSAGLNKVRQIIYNLRPEELDRLGLGQAIKAMVDRAAQSVPTRFSVDIEDVDGLLPPVQEINLYRVFQEGINNIIKHSQASCACIVLQKKQGTMHLFIRDDGVGFKENGSLDKKLNYRNSFGLAGMNKRVRMMGGELEVHSKAGEGVTVQAVIPIKTNATT